MSGLVWFCLLLTQEEGPEFVVSAYGGLAKMIDADLRLALSGGTDLTFHDPSYDDDSFKLPWYYGLRATCFFDRRSPWGVALEFIHAKTYLNTDDVVRVTGTRAGVPVDADERVGDTIGSFGISHGLNFLMADFIARWFPAERGEGFWGRFQPYVGAGIGLVLPHVESDIGGRVEEGFQLDGPALQGFVGINGDIAGPVSAFLEYKFSWADLDLRVPEGSVEIDPRTHHFVWGVSVRF